MAWGVGYKAEWDDYNYVLVLFLCLVEVNYSYSVFAPRILKNRIELVFLLENKINFGEVE